MFKQEEKEVEKWRERKITFSTMKYLRNFTKVTHNLAKNCFEITSTGRRKKYIPCRVHTFKRASEFTYVSINSKHVQNSNSPSCTFIKSSNCFQLLISTMVLILHSDAISCKYLYLATLYIFSLFIACLLFHSIENSIIQLVDTLADICMASPFRCSPMAFDGVS